MDTYTHPIYGDLAVLDTSKTPRISYLRGTRAPIIVVEAMLIAGVQPHDICETPWLHARGAEETVELLGDILFYREQDAAEAAE